MEKYVSPYFLWKIIYFIGDRFCDLKLQCLPDLKWIRSPTDCNFNSWIRSTLDQQQYPQHIHEASVWNWHTLTSTEIHVHSYIRNVSTKSKEDLVTSLGRINCVPRIRNAFERLSFALIYVLINDVTRPRPGSFSPHCVHKGSAVILSSV